MKKKSKNKKSHLLDIGWREWISLNEYQNFYLKAKIDTGASMSALHATHIKEYDLKNHRYVEFRVHQSNKYKNIQKPILGYKTIKSSIGKKQSRPVVNFIIKIGENIINTNITLTARSRMTYPVLIGRSSLGKNYRVNPKRSFLFGKKNGN